MNCRVSFPPSIQAAILSWGIPRETLVEFYRNLADDLERPDGVRRLRLTAEDDLYRYVASVHDFEQPGRHYEFFLGLEVEVDELRVVQCDCWLVDRHGDILCSWGR